MRSLIFASAAALALSACTTTGSIDSAIQKNLPQICSAAATAHSAFLIVASTGDIKQRTVAKEAAAWSALDVVCKDPGSVTAATALVKAAEAYAAITLALREAKAAE
ncbi:MULTISPECIES: cell wall anchor protein [unclassified Sinorhizobium]|uniref:cell wall anchor protein n=1 Tax=unclassified Sinorhizobium TaxID=2613772 RepID=UPI0024C30A50|nr:MULTISPECIES: cell wall anchor protein [unclassified Sinorhizobium]MDK1377084.1 cell wall anchor protein [Sinorhizobium sp. 6-70]MDK1479621.1 cell wall anchor protein [Sinorhizobium sp. 6-117]